MGRARRSSGRAWPSLLAVHGRRGRCLSPGRRSLEAGTFCSVYCIALIAKHEKRPNHGGKEAAARFTGAPCRAQNNSHQKLLIPQREKWNPFLSRPECWRKGDNERTNRRGAKRKRESERGLEKGTPRQRRRVEACYVHPRVARVNHHRKRKRSAEFSLSFLQK